MPVRGKAENRRCEFLLHDAEFFATILPNAPGTYPAAALADAWKLVLRHQSVSACGRRPRTTPRVIISVCMRLPIR